MLQFQHNEYLWALIGIPLLVALFFYTLLWKKKTALKIGDKQLVAALIKNYSTSRYKLKFALILLGYSAAVIALAAPRSATGNSTIKRNGIDVMIALDVSKSMLAQDIQPNRLERAKQLIRHLIDILPDDRIGIVVFAGKAYLQMPLTADHAAAKMFLSTASPEMIPTQGTVIGDALKMCYAAFNTKEKKYKSILLISDGEDHDENAVKIARELAGEGIVVNTVGIGSIDGSTITDAATGKDKTDANGELIITKLNETILKNIAVEGTGLYQFYSNSNEVANRINTQVKGMEKRTITENSTAIYSNYFQWFLALTVILLVIELFTSEKSKNFSLKKSTAKPIKKMQGSLLMLMAFILPFSAFAQKENTLLKEGNKAYADNKFEEAATNYAKALETNKTSNKAALNLGNALYKKGEKEEAVKAYEQAVDNSKSANDKSAAWYNKGVVLQNDKKLAECIEAYKHALRQNPADEDARFNLQKALIKQQEQKNKEQKQDKQQQKNKEKNKDEQPKPQQSKMTKKEAEEKLKALLQQEKNLQDKLRRAGEASPDKPEKDW